MKLAMQICKSACAYAQYGAYVCVSVPSVLKAACAVSSVRMRSAECENGDDTTSHNPRGWRVDM